MPRLAGLAARLIGTYWWYTAEGTGVSAAGLGVLAALDEEDGLRSGEVAARSWVTPPMVSYLADVLERDGYLIRRRDSHDRRVVHLHLTGKGREKLRDAREHVAARWQTAFGYIEPADEPVIRQIPAVDGRPVRRPDRAGAAVTAGGGPAARARRPPIRAWRGASTSLPGPGDGAVD